MEIGVLGPLVVHDAGRPLALGGRRQRSVLAGLVVLAGEPASAERLIDVVWGAVPPPTARKSLQTYIARLRRSLGPATIRSAEAGYVLDTATVDLDADRFAALAEEARQLLGTDPAATWERCDEALRLWRGAPLADLDLDGTHGFVARLEELRFLVLEARVDAGLRLGRHADLIGELRVLVDAHPLREGFWSRLMLALYRSGRQADALAAYQRYRRVLDEELALDPSPALRTLETAILRHDPDLAAPQGVIAGRDDAPGPGEDPDVGQRDRARNPYKGLRAFAEEDAPDFFGREALVSELLERVEAGARCLALVGPSGSGKSSVVRAGLVPALRNRTEPRNRLVARMTPGSHPFTQLEVAIDRAAGGEGHAVPVPPDDDLGLLKAVLAVVPDERTDLVLVIDQFEELLTTTIAQETVRAFARNLAEAVEDPHGQLLVILTLRADFLDRALRIPELAELLAAGSINVAPLDAAELHAAIVGPAQAVGLRIEPDLVAELVTEVAHHPGSLPLLQFVLTELTDGADGGILTLAALRQAGGIHGTLARHAEALHASLSPEARDAVRRLMLHLVSLGEHDEPVRRVVHLDQLASPSIGEEDRRAALETLVTGRLLVLGRDPISGRTTVEVVHEAVLREWPRCAGWIDEAAGDIRRNADLERSAAEWVAAGRSEDYLLTGSRLELHEDRPTNSELARTSAAEEYIVASRQRRDAQQRLERDREARERALELRAVRRLQVSVAVLVVLVLVAGGLSLIAARRGAEAARQREVAVAAVSEMLVRQLSSAAVAEAGRDPELSLLLSLHAVRVATLGGEPVADETVEALHWGIQGSGVQYPVGDAEPELLVGADGPRGAFALPPAELVELAQETIGRQLTPEECRSYLPTQDCAPLPQGLAADLIPADDDGDTAATLAGTKVRVGSPPDPFIQRGLSAELAGFTDATGIEVVLVESSWAQVPELGDAAPELIDVHLVAQPLALRAEVAAGRLMDLTGYLPESELREAYGDHLLAFGSGDGAGGDGLHALPVNVAAKSLVWYPRRAFEAAGYSIPRTWQDLIDLSDRIVADGGTPWCFTEEVDDGSSSGWPATDWIEDLVLHEHGPAVYDDWVAGDIPFSDPRVRAAFERLGRLVFSEGYVAGGGPGAARSPIGTGWWQMFDDPPGCWLYHFPAFAASLAPPDVAAGEELDAFLTPTIEPAHDDTMLVQTSWAVAYTDRPEVRELVRYLADPGFGADGYLEVVKDHIAPHRDFDQTAYPEDWRRVVAEAFSRSQAADSVRNDGSDSMSDGAGIEPFWNAMLAYLRGGPESLDTVLAGLDEERERLRSAGAASTSTRDP